MKNKSTLLILSTALVMCFLFTGQMVSGATTTEDFEKEQGTPMDKDNPLYDEGGMGLLDFSEECTEQDYWTDHTTSITTFYGNQKRTQTFTATTSYNYDFCGSNMWGYRIGTGGTITLELFNTDTNGKPTGTALITAESDGTAWTNDTAGEEVSFECSGTYELSTGTKYALSYKSSASVTENRQALKGNNNAYTGGEMCESEDSGGTWTCYAYDLYFKTFGTESTGESTSTATSTLTGDYTESITFLGLIFWIFAEIIIFLLTFFVVLKA